MNEQVTTLFEREQSYPDPDAKGRYEALVGIDDAKNQVSRMLGILLNPGSLSAWAKKFHPNAADLILPMMARPPLVVFEGEVGSGKSELAECVGDPVSRANDGLPISLLPISLTSRGKGHVGEMTNLLSKAFDQVIDRGKKLRRAGKPAGALILLVDEADAIAQSRETSQMHHEDKAGVNAFIRGLDRIANERIPVAVILCTNRLGALDPAVRRRAAAIFKFTRPNAEQRMDVVKEPLSVLGLKSQDIAKIVEVTGERQSEKLPGFTYSDLRQRLIPAIVLEAYPDRAVDPNRAIAVALNMIPTPSFKEEH